MELTADERIHLELIQMHQRAVAAEVRLKEVEFRNRLAWRTGIPAEAISINPLGGITDARVEAPLPAADEPMPIHRRKRTRDNKPAANGHRMPPHNEAPSPDNGVAAEPTPVGTD